MQNESTEKKGNIFESPVKKLQLREKEIIFEIDYLLSSQRVLLKRDERLKKVIQTH